MKQWFRELKTKWKMAKMKSQIAMVEHQLRMLVEIGGPHMVLEIPTTAILNDEIRDQASRRFRELAEASGYQFCESLAHDVWLVEFRNPEIIIELVQRQHEAIGNILEHIREAASKGVDTINIQVLKIIADDSSFSKDQYVNLLAPTATELGYKVTQTTENEYWCIQFVRQYHSAGDVHIGQPKY